MQRALLMRALAACSHAGTAAAPTPPHMAWGLVLHGGAGVITRDKLTPAREAAIRTELARALRAAHAVLARGGYQHEPLAQAADDVVRHELVHAQGDGGSIAMDADGHWTLTFNTPGMYRGYITEDGVPHIDIFR